MSDRAYNSALIQIQKLANESATNIQKMVNSSNELQMKYNTAEAQKARDWQTEMSKTAHQMEVEDLKKAGLNPVLSTGGSGAQSYTTSSASTQNDSGASAASGILGSQLGALSSMESSRLTSEAQKKAAATNAAAIKRAAETSAAAQRYAAAVDYAKAKYQADRSYEASKYSSDKKAQTDITVARIGRGKTWSGLLDKYIEGSSLGSAARGIVKRTIGNGISGFNKLINNPKKFYEDSWLLQHAKKGIVKPNFNGLNKAGRTLIDDSLRKIGLSVNNRNRKQMYNAFVLKNQASANYIFSTVYRNRAGTIRRDGYVINSRRGHL